MLVILLSVLGILLHNASANTSSCSMEDLRACRADALTQMSGSGSDAVKEEKQCRDLRENFDCMLWQTSMCFKKEDQDSNSDVIWKTWRYLEGFCEKYGNWWASSCFQRDDVKRCESLLPSKRNSLDSQSCSMFLNFRDCVLSIAGSSCSSSDRNLLGTYFMQKGQQMSWRCPKDSDYVSMSAASAQQVDRRYPDMYSDSSYSCTVNARSELSTCSQKFEETRRDAMNRDDGDMRNHKLCCGLVRLEECIHRATNKRCGTDVRRRNEDYISSVRSNIETDCRDHTAYACNNAKGTISRNAAPTIYSLLYLVFSIFMIKFF